jgi:hypothetical protein
VVAKTSSGEVVPVEVKGYVGREEGEGRKEEEEGCEGEGRGDERGGVKGYVGKEEGEGGMEEKEG